MGDKCIGVTSLHETYDRNKSKSKIIPARLRAFSENENDTVDDGEQRLLYFNNRVSQHTGTVEGSRCPKGWMCHWQAVQLAAKKHKSTMSCYTTDININ
jgi:hypothetical protein